MDTIGKLLTHVSSQLNDQRHNREFLRWNRSVLVEYYVQALEALRSYRIDAFTTQTTIMLTSGTQQKVSGYSQIISVDANADGTPAHTGDVALLKAFAAYSVCPPKLQLKNGVPVYRVKTVGIDKADPSVFYVSPPVPPGFEASVKATVVQDIPAYTVSDWSKPHIFDAKYVNVVIDFMQARAYELDIESRTAKQDSARFMQKFYTALGISYKMDSALGSGYYKGQTGNGDPRAVAV